MKSNGLAPDDYDEVSADIGRALHASGDTLRPSLLVANQELYGEYDRLNSEGSFRINVCLPLLALGASLTISVSWWWLLAALTTVYVLLSQGLRRRSQSITVIQGAVLSGIIKHPAKSILERFG